MNRVHALICSSGWWKGSVERKLLPWALRGLDLGDDILEIGPGFGATTEVLARRSGRLSVVELEQSYCERLRRELGERVTVVQADATTMPFEDARFSSVVCFTMLHHLPSPAMQDRLLGEVSRVLRPGGLFAGTDSLGTGPLFKLIHIGDTLVPVGPDGMARRIESAGLRGAQVDRGGRSFRFRAHKPLAPGLVPTAPPASATGAPDLL
ncbi:MAG TPA: class I SAM-dependent methyltransferase [Solirubrobacteraceae bacterium]|nr:class I SAM-dependent methyltransferase [Solirubrobacteraceae bacterium]